jgi:hypothetical protein
LLSRIGKQPWLRLAVAVAVSGCASRGALKPGLRGGSPAAQYPQSQGPVVPDDHVPRFASVPWEPLSRADVVAIAQREWRLFGQPIDDDPPDTRPPPLPEDKPERMPGLWQRVGEYWWIGQDPDEIEAAWTGIHDASGTLFPADQDAHYAWSAAFISYVMRIAGAGRDFPYSPNHATYINAAASGATPLLRAYRPSAYAPMAGDLVCFGRGKSAALTFDDLPTAASFPSHCAIVTAVRPGEITIIGGNVDDAVTLTHVPTTQDGMLADAQGLVIDTRYPWLVVLKVNYQPIPGDTPPVALQPPPVNAQTTAASPQLAPLAPQAAPAAAQAATPAPQATTPAPQATPTAPAPTPQPAPSARQ